MSSLSKMPELVMENIIGFSDFRSVLTLCQVCKDFQNFIDRLNDSKLPDSEFSTIDLIVNEDIFLNYEDLDDNEYNYIYSVSENSRSFDGKTKDLGNSNVLDVVMRDLEFVLKFQKSKLDSLNFLLYDSQPPNNLSIDTSPVKLSNMLQRFNRKIRTRSLWVFTDIQPNIMSILPFIEPETLEVLDLDPLISKKKIEINDIVKTEQWRKVKINYFRFVALNLDVEDICHFLENTIKLLSISARELDFLRKTFISLSDFKKCSLYVNKFNDKKELSNYWGAAFNDQQSSCWYFRIKDSEENILRIKIKKYRRTDIYFDVILLRYVPTGAIVHDCNEY